MSSEQDRAGPIAWMARNPVAANLLMLFLIIGGLWSGYMVQKEVFPQFELDVVEVSVSYPGASPAEVEDGILLPVEEAVRGIQGVDEMTSTAREGGGRVRLAFVGGADRMKVYQDIDQAVSRIRTFPDQAEQPEVRLQDRQRSVMRIGLYGDIDVWSLRQLAEQVRDRLVSDPVITQVEISRAPEYVTHVEISQDRLRAHGLTLGDVAQRIRLSARDIPAGAIETGKGEILLRVKERKQWASELATIPIVASDGGVIPLSSLARIVDGFEETNFHGQFNRQPSIGLQIYRVGDQSPLEIAKAVTLILEELQTSLPDGVQARIDSNQAHDFRDRLSLLVKNGLLGLVIVFVILSAFLEVRLAFWIMVGMGLSFVGALIFLPAAGVSINMISMFAFLVVLGIVVDDAIVVGENVYERREAGDDPVTAAIEGTRDIAKPVVFSILTTIVAFMPVLFLPGETGQYWRPLPVVVSLVLLLSLVEALFILPAHLAHTRLPTRSTRSLQQRISRGFKAGIDRLYRPFLRSCLHNRYITLSAALSLLVIVGGYAASDHMGLIMMPEVAADEIEAGVRLPVGTTPAQAAKVAWAITESTSAMFDEHDLYEVAEGIKTNVRGGNFIDVEIVMKPPNERDMTAAQVIALWRDQIGDIAGIDQITFEAERGPGGWRDDIEVALSHSDIELLFRAAMDLKAEAERFEAARDVSDNYNRGKAQLDLTLRPLAAVLGLTPEAVGAQVRDAFFGALAIRQLRGTNEVEVRVKLPEAEREALRTLDRFVIRAPGGVEVPLRDVADVQEDVAYTSLNRRDGRRVISVSMDVEPKRATSRVLDALRAEVLPELRANYPGLTWTFEGTQAEMRKSTTSLWSGFVLAMCAVYALLAVAFRSYAQPLIVMSAIPFGIVGAVLGHMLLGYDISLISVMGVVALAGVVVNDSLIMVDQANRHRAQNAAPLDAIHRAGVRRFRPIVLTTLTTFGGLTPIILEGSIQAQNLIPMAISLGFGIVFATAIILVIVPCFYMVLEDLRSLVATQRAKAWGP